MLLLTFNILLLNLIATISTFSLLTHKKIPITTNPLFIHKNRHYSKLVMADFNSKEFVDNLVNNHKVTVISKTYCPYCQSAIKVLESYNIKDMHVEQIESHTHMSSIQDYLEKLTGARSVPRVFIGGKFFGDSSKTVSSHNSGVLKEALEKAGAL